MLDLIQQILNEVQHYLKIKQSCILDYLNLWKGRDNKDGYFNDFMMLKKIQINIDQLEDLETLKSNPTALNLIKPRDVSINKSPIVTRQGSRNVSGNYRGRNNFAGIKDKDTVSQVKSSEPIFLNNNQINLQNHGNILNQQKQEIQIKKFS